MSSPLARNVDFLSLCAFTTQTRCRFIDRGCSYLSGSTVPELISPDNWHFDYLVTLQRPEGRQLQLDLFYDYRTNVKHYPEWQESLKTHQPKTIIFLGQGDIFFTPAGGEAFLEVRPKAEMHRLNAGHFAVDDCLGYISKELHRFYDEKVVA